MTASPAPRLGRPPKLRRDEVLDGALSLGLPSFTVARLAVLLGVSEGALYHHFASRDEIVDAACSRLFEQVDTEAPTDVDAARPADGEDWQRYLEAICAQIRTLAIEQPGFGPWLVAGSYDQPTLRRFERILVGITRRAPQFDDDTAYLVGSQAVACTVGLVVSGFVGSVPEQPTEHDLDEQFRWMLRSLLRGMAAQLADGVPPPRRQALDPDASTG